MVKQMQGASKQGSESSLSHSLQEAHGAFRAQDAFGHFGPGTFVFAGLGDLHALAASALKASRSSKRGFEIRLDPLRK